MLTRTRLMSLSVILAAVAVAAEVRGQSTNPTLQAVADALVGTWSGEGVYAADYPGVGKKGERFTSTSTCRWAAGRAAIACEGKEAQSSWNTLIYWDAGAKQVRIVGVNSGGNSDQGTVVKQGDRLAWTSSGHFADGRAVEFRWETTLSDNGNTRIETGATILGGVRSEFKDTYRKIAK